MCQIPQGTKGEKDERTESGGKVRRQIYAQLTLTEGEIKVPKLEYK